MAPDHSGRSDMILSHFQPPVRLSHLSDACTHPRSVDLLPQCSHATIYAIMANSRLRRLWFCASGVAMKVAEHTAE